MASWEEKRRALCFSWENEGLSVWIFSPKTKKCDIWKVSGEGWWGLATEFGGNGEKEEEEKDDEKCLERVKREIRRVRECKNENKGVCVRGTLQPPL